MSFFKGWHRPTVCTTIIAVVILLVVYHVLHGHIPHPNKEG